MNESNEKQCVSFVCKRNIYKKQKNVKPFFKYSYFFCTKTLTVSAIFRTAYQDFFLYSEK